MIGNYHLLLKFGNNIIPVSSASLRELTITQDLNKMLPEFRLRLDDVSGAMTHTSPFDKNMSEVYCELAINSTSEDRNYFTFDIYRRQPQGVRGDASTDYDIQGLLKLDGLFSPSYSRGHSGNIKTNIETIATDELEVDKTEVSSSLSYSKTLVQPLFSNIQFLNYLKHNIIGINGEYGYKCFVKTSKGKNTFVFRNLPGMIQDPVSYKFILKDTAEEDFLPVYEYYIYDNYKINEVFSSKQQCYSYFNYTTSTFTEATEVVEDYLSLTDYFLIDQSDSTDNNCSTPTGRSNDFTSDFKGKVKGSYGNRLLGLVKMWITTEGLPNAVPGQTVMIFFPQGAQADKLYSYQYAGYWLVERVVHNCGDGFLTKLLLTRHGLDTDKKTTLVKAALLKKA